MQKEPNYIIIGRTRKAHGIAGELKVSIEERYLEDFLKNERIFLSIKSAKMPFFISEVRGKGELILKLEEVDDRDAAIALQSKEILLRAEDLVPDEAREFEVETSPTLAYEHLKGYQILDEHQGVIGEINEVLELPQQEMAAVAYQGREVLIPLHSAFILQIDMAKRIVSMNLPEGLLDI